MSSPSGVRDGAQEALALFVFLVGKIQHLINISTPNLLKWTSRKKVRQEGDDDIDTILYNIEYNDFNTANPNILLIKVLRSHLQSQTSQTQIPTKLTQIE